MRALSTHLNCQRLLLKLIMGNKKDLSVSEKGKIVQFLHEGKSSLEISKLLNRDHRTIKKLVEDVNKKRPYSLRKSVKTITARHTRKLKRIMTKNILMTSAEGFCKGWHGRCETRQEMQNPKNHRKLQESNLQTTFESNT